ncbi:CDP-alcohol phosphatidyltransferase family protein [Ruania halotolerans]|uniref:CDP-alcohol phosphatidyltransferase family protein n=1 Tax=Ruania halotolerans TaxID=2897773 RepID=UPI001E637399|nr:CDP-alcohol phosphatidyltransferase family protein [Ruania halotolerans]UFU06113.1 CDP-alcohol phosphatidyltransferase family protein [Ruania halotolerans]
MTGRGSAAAVRLVATVLPVLLLLILAHVKPIPPAGVILAILAGAAVPLVASILVNRRTAGGRFLPGDEVTLLRTGLIGGCAGYALLLPAGLSAQSWPIFVVALIAWVMDGLDGIVARRSGTASAEGGRFDVEADAVFVLAVSVIAAATVGWWVLVIGLMRYLWVVLSWWAPPLNRPLAHRPSRRRIAGFQGGVLVATLAPITPAPLAALACALALGFLIYSFARDGVHAWRSGRGSDPPVTVWG